MKKKFNFKAVLYPIILAVFAFSVFNYVNDSIVGAATCCMYGNQCPDGKGRDPTLKCCLPRGSEAPCSQSLPNYCRETC
jgi:hypothetical protein